VIAAVLNLRSCEHKKSHIHVKTHLTQDIPPVKADRVAMQQVILNLITNAEYFMLEKRDAGCLEISSRCEAGKVVVDVINDGPAIRPEDCPYIFEPFYTTRPDRKGTGLGLSICRKIMKEHSGRIFADGKYKQGAKFTIELPASDSSED
jgi:two-component system NtrC family sensor kinase